jgi:tRNA dimethylallyltransferase
MSDHPRPILVLGPTAGGKSELAARLASRLDGEVISADSMQIYKRMDAGTAKPPGELRRQGRHHLIDLLEPTERFTVADWLERAEPLIQQLQQLGRVPVVVGGTNLYINALLEGMFQGPRADPEFRKSLEPIPAEQLHERLKPIDPEAADRISPADRKRLVRALEVHHLTGRPISDWQRQWQQQRQARYRYNPYLLGLHWPAEALNPRINYRVKAMFHPEKVEPGAAEAACPNGESLPEETTRLEREGWLGPQARQALGYKQVLRHLHGEWSRAEAFEQTRIQTRRFAKQQRTWLKRFRGVHWLPMDRLDPDQALTRALEAVDRPEPCHKPGA